MAESTALRLADALDDEFVQGRISNHTGRKAAAELRRLHATNIKLLGALDMIRETLNGGEVDDLLYIINKAIKKAEEKNMT